MLQMIDENRTPAHWAEKTKFQAARAINPSDSNTEGLRVALINNMPDPALEDTESQFFNLLDVAADTVPVHVKLFSLPGIPRGENGRAHLASSYCDFQELFESRFDGVIITGTEPHQPDLKQEAYWPCLVELFSWAEENTSSAVLSCLAAHAAVLQGDGIRRHRLADKKFGIFDEWKLTDHFLIKEASEPLRFPHSRWNELREDALAAAGYSLLTKSSQAGVNLFVKKRRNSLFVHFQGHPEYGAGTLAKEFRRDVKRFLRKERETYPTLPHGYFDTVKMRALGEFREKALREPHDRLMSQFPEQGLNGTGESVWRSAATSVYRNWLQYLTLNKASRVRSAVASPFAGG